MAIQANKIFNASVYVDGTSYLGQVSEFELPSLNQIMVDHEALGLIGKIQMPAGIESMEAKLAFNSYYPAAIGIAANPGIARQFQIRGNLETHTSEGRTGQQAAVVFLTGTFKTLPLGTFRQHENVTLECMINVTKMRLEIGGVPVVEFDAFANIYKVNGADIAATYRNNIGQ